MSLAAVGGLRLDPDALARLSPAEQEQVREELRVVEAAFKENPLLGYRPHAKQAIFHAPEAGGWWPPLRAFFGGNRSGKTEGATCDRLIQQVDRDVLPEHLRAFKRWEPPVYGRILTPDLTSTMDGVIHEKIRRYCPRSQLKGNSFDRAFDKVQRVLHFKNGSWIQFNSSEQDREKLGGVALHWVYYDEEPRQEVRKECLTRLIDFDGEEIFALTPFSGMAWLFDEVYEPWERGRLDPRDGRVVVVDMDDNPHLSESGKKRALAQYSGPEREARKSGRFVSFSGLIYPQFGEDHIIPQIERVPPGAEVFRGIDPGYRHMCAVGYYYLDADDELVKFDEIAVRGATVKDVCDEMRRRDARWGERKDDGRVFPLVAHWTVIDPSARNKNNQTGRSDQAEFQEHGVFTIPGQNAVGAGINRVKERLDAGKFKVTANCVVTIAQYRRYRWVKDDGRGEDEARERPVKKDDHQLDCLVAGTLISTARGEVPIEDVHAGDRVWTRSGLRLVTEWWRTAGTPAVLRLETPEGDLVGTAGHRVFVQRRGFVRLDSVRYGDTMVLWRTSMSLRGAASRFGAIRTPIVVLTAFTSILTRGIGEMVLDGCTRRFGRLSMGLFQPASTSIIATAIPSTTVSTTSNACLRLTIRPSTRQSTPTRDGRRLRGFARWRRLGIRRSKEGPGMWSMAAPSWPGGLLGSPCASTAATSSIQLTLSGSVLNDARLPQGARRELMTRIASAWRAARRTASTVTPQPRRVRVSAAPRPVGTAAVYDLTVDGAHEFFANGLLVHNCDRYVIMQRPLAPRRDVEKASDTMKDRILRHHLRKLGKKRLPDSGFGPGQWA